MWITFGGVGGKVLILLGVVVVVYIYIILYICLFIVLFQCSSAYL